MSPPPSRPSPSDAASERPASPPTEVLPSQAAPTPDQDGATGTIIQVALSPAAPERTEVQDRQDSRPAGTADGTLIQRLSDRLMSESISLRMKAAGYKLIKPLGEGTYGLVWLAEEESTGIRVAIKFFAHGAGRKWQMLQDEVRQLAALDSAAGIVHLKDAVADADPPYYVMSYAEGGSLAQRLEKGPLPVKEALAIFEEVVQALAYVHAHGIRHCDLKPGNVLLDRLGKPLVADFGQAHLSNDATPALGTFFYMAPEQADLTHQIPDTRWDVYGLGALFYAMLTGQPPRKDIQLSGELMNTVELSSRLRRYRQGIAQTARPMAHHDMPGVDRPLARIIDGCLEINPKKRLASAEAILGELKRRRVRMRQRPLLLVGMIAPLLIIGALLAIGGFVAERQIHASERMLVEQVLENDQATARLAAAGLGRGFKRRFEVVEGLLHADGQEWAQRIADAREARRAAADGDADKVRKWQEARAGLKEWLKRVAETQKLDERFYISGLTVVDRDGYMLMAVSKEDGWGTTADFEETSAKRKWAWRDWFCGQGNWKDEEKWRPPVSSPHISQPYKSRDDKEKLDMTVPVALPDEPGAPVGILVGSMKWAELSKWLDELKMKHGRVAVFNDRSQFLMHGDDDVLATIKDYHDNPPAYDGLATALRAGETTLESYDDPMDKSTYLAGYKTFDPFRDPAGDVEPGAAGRWAVVVQHNKAEVLQPVENLYGQLKIVGACVVAGAVVFTGGLWWGLFWLLRRQERLGHG